MLAGLTHFNVPVTILRKKAGLVFHPLGFDVKTQRACMTWFDKHRLFFLLTYETNLCYVQTKLRQIETQTCAKKDRQKMDDIAELHGKRYHNSHSRTYSRFQKNFEALFLHKRWPHARQEPTNVASVFTLPTVEILGGEKGAGISGLCVLNEIVQKNISWKYEKNCGSRLEVTC